jgi:putative membrane protein
MLAHGPWADGGWWFFAPIFWIGVWILFFALLRGIFWRRHWRHYQHRGWGGWGGEQDPRNILAGRYARGEINEQEYKERLAVLNGPQTP